MGRPNPQQRARRRERMQRAAADERAFNAACVARGVSPDARIYARNDKKAERAFAFAKSGASEGDTRDLDGVMIRTLGQRPRVTPRPMSDAHIAAMARRLAQDDKRGHVARGEAHVITGPAVRILAQARYDHFKAVYKIKRAWWREAWPSYMRGYEEGYNAPLVASEGALRVMSDASVRAMERATVPTSVALMPASSANRYMEERAGEPGKPGEPATRTQWLAAVRRGDKTVEQYAAWVRGQ